MRYLVDATELRTAVLACLASGEIDDPEAERMLRALRGKGSGTLTREFPEFLLCPGARLVLGLVTHDRSH